MEKYLQCSGSSKNSAACSIDSEEENKNEKPINKGRSEVWKFFVSQTGNSAKCNFCSTIVKTGGNTTNLFNHLKRSHPNSLQSEKNLQTMQTFFDPKKTANKQKAAEERKSDLDNALIKMIALDMQPFQIVEDKGFRYFVHCLDPSYVLPSRKKLRDVLLVNMYEEMNIKMKNMLKNVKYCGITADGWSSRANDYYLTVTCHFVNDYSLKSVVLSTDKLLSDIDHRSENIEKSLRAVLEEWNVIDKVAAIVTDNAASMVKACELLKKRHLPCFAHTLNLIVQSAISMPAIKGLISKCKQIVAFFKSSNTAYSKLKKAQNRETPYSLVQEMPTRWNSSLNMMKRLLEIKDAVSKTLLEIIKAPSPLTAEEIELLNELVKIFEPFEEATTQASSNTQISISLIIPMSFNLMHKITEIQTALKTVAGVEVSSQLLSDIRRRLFPYQLRTATKIATLLDPRFKKEAFLTKSSADQAANALEQELSAMQATYPSVMSEPPTPSSTPSMFAYVLKNIAQKSKTPHVDAIISMRQYFENEHTTADSCPLEYWKNLSIEKPFLAECAEKFLCIPASSTESERMFSATGYIISNRRASLKPKNVNMLVFCNKNQWIID